MISIGLRVEPKKITFAIIDLEKNEILNIEKLIVPISLDVPEQLKYIRLNLLDIISEYNVNVAGIRITESNAQTPNVERIQIEGVIQEAFASSSIEKYFIGQISSISAKLGFPRGDFKKYVENSLIFNIEGWNELKAVEKEAIFVALGAA